MKKNYSIGVVAKKFDLTVSTLRYYEESGVTDYIFRNRSGSREYTEDDINWLDFVCNMKSSGMPLDDIRNYRKLVKLGDETSKERRNIIIEHKKRLTSKRVEIDNALDLIEYKICYYNDLLKKHNLI